MMTAPAVLCEYPRAALPAAVCAAHGTLVPNVEIGDRRRPWNENSQDQAKRGKGRRRRPTTRSTSGRRCLRGWTRSGACAPGQGLEWNYRGVILGDDLVWRDGAGCVSSDCEPCDSAFRDLDDVDALVKQACRVLLTRGPKGTFLYSTYYDIRGRLRELAGG